MKKSKVVKKGMSFIVIMTFIITGCSHTALITTNPSGAKVTIESNTLGLSPVSFNDTSGFPKVFFVKINKRGYKEINVPIKQAYKGDVTLLWLIPGIFPYFLTATLNDAYNFNLEKKWIHNSIFYIKQTAKDGNPLCRG